MGRIPPLIDATLSNADNSYSWYIVSIVVILTITITFIRTKLPPTALKDLARQIDEVDQALSTSTRILEPQFISDCNADLEK